MGIQTTPAAGDDDDLLTTIGLLVEAHAGLASILERRMLEHGAVTGQSFEILLRLVRSEDRRLRMSDLAAQTTLTASGLTRAVDRLERGGLVRREACPADRRVSYAALTEDGATRIESALPLHRAHLEEVLGAVLSAEEKRALAQLLRRVRDALNPGAACASEPGGIPEEAAL